MTTNRLLSCTALAGIALFGLTIALSFPASADDECGALSNDGSVDQISCGPTQGEFGISYPDVQDDLELNLNGTTQDATADGVSIANDAGFSPNITVYTSQFPTGPTDPSIISDESTPALEVSLDEGGNIAVDHDFGSFTNTGTGEGISLYTTSGDIDVNIASGASVTAHDNTGISLLAESGNITVVNAGTVSGDGDGDFTGGDGLYASASGTVDVTNSSFTSMVGAYNGMDLVYSNQVIVDNTGGLTVGLSGEGIEIYEIYGSGLGPTEASVAITNTNGAIGGYWDGIDITDLYNQDEVPTNELTINNSGDLENNTVVTRGGLILGTYGQGIDTYETDGDVIIDNSQTWNQAVNVAGVQSAIGSFSGDVEQLTTDLFGAGLSGIFGATDGIRINDAGEYYHDADGYVAIDNTLGLIGGWNGNGVSISYVGADTSTGMSVDLDNSGGLIAGLDGYGIDVSATMGSVFIDNGMSGTDGDNNDIGGGIILALGDGAGNGVNISSVDGDVVLYNYDGTIYSESGSAVAVYAVDSSATSYLGYYSNGSGSYDTYDNGYYIAPMGSAFSVSSLGDVYINSGGLAVGEGSDSYSTVWVAEVDNAYVRNDGILGSANLPGFTVDGDTINTTILNGVPIDFFAAADDYDGIEDIWNEVSDIAIYAMSAGYEGSLYNLENYENAADDYAVMTSTVGTDFHYSNYGLTVGRLDLDTSTPFNRMYNYGTWMTLGSNELGDSGSIYNYDGALIQTAFGNYESDSTSFNLNWFSNDGVLSMTDGDTYDQTNIYFRNTGDYSSGWSGWGSVAMDVDFYNRSADLLSFSNYSSDYYYNIEGSNGLILNVLNETPGGIDNYGIDVVSYDGDANIDNWCYGPCREGDAFYISPYSDGYFEVAGVGVIGQGMFMSYLAQDDNWQDFELRTTWSPTADQLPSLLTQLQNTWYQTNDVVADHIRGNRWPDGLGYVNVANADYIVAQPDIAPEQNNKGVWVKVQGSWTNRDTTVFRDIGGMGTALDTSYDQDIYSVLAGADMRFGNDGPFRAGIFGGYVHSSADFTAWAASADFSGGTIGAYLDYTRGAFYADATVKADFLSTDYSANVNGMNPVSGSPDASNIGFHANTGYRMQGNRGFLEPIASIAYVSSSIDDFTSGGARVSFSNGQSFRAGAGARVGTDFSVSNGARMEVAVLGKIWNEFEDANQVTVTDLATGDTASFQDGIDGVFGEVSAVLNVTNLNQNMSGFVSGGAEFNSTTTTFNTKAGFRFNW